MARHILKFSCGITCELTLDEETGAFNCEWSERPTKKIASQNPARVCAVAERNHRSVGAAFRQQGSRRRFMKTKTSGKVKKKEKRCDRCREKIKGVYVAYDSGFYPGNLCFRCATHAWLQTQDL
jgi:hypothetical protein